MTDDTKRFLAGITTPELLVDEPARESFKALKPALRRDLDGHPFVPLSAPRGPAVVSLGDRRSHRMFGSGPVGFEDLSELLGVLCERIHDGNARRAYASAGGAYPVQTYVLATDDVEGVPGGLYYHHPVAHRLVLVDALSRIDPRDQFPANRAWMGRAKLLVLLVAKLDAIAPLYGRKARDFALLEAGQMVQLLQSVSARCAVGLCQSGLLDDSALRASLALGPTDELVGVLAGGPVARAAAIAQASDALRARVTPAVEAPRPRAATLVEGPRTPVVDAHVTPASAPARATAAPAPGPTTSAAARAGSSQRAAGTTARTTARARHIEGELSALWCELLGAERVDREAQFFDIGATSIVAARAVRTLQHRYAAVQLAVADVFAHPTVRELAAAIDARLPPDPAAAEDHEAIEEHSPLPPTVVAPPHETPRAHEAAASPRAYSAAATPRSAADPHDAAIAIIGLAVELPGAPTLERLWSNLIEGRSFVGPMPAARRALVPSFVPRSDQQFVAAYLESVETFAPLFFHMSPREAESVDPVQRLMLMVAAQALTHAGYWREQLAGSRTGVYIGASHSGYADLCAPQQDLSRILPGNMTGIVAGRISHFFDLRGPSVVIDTACSSSLVAVDQACRALLLGDAELAVAGGVNVILSPRPFEAFRQDGMESTRGACRSFDAGADGFVRGEGAAALVLKRLGAALADGDHVHAVIRGSAINHDGRTSALPVPSPGAQRDVILEAHRRGGTRPSEVSYVEAHGTGTALGDPIEVRGLTDAFRTDVETSGACALGSIKTNLGHLEFAAGVVGVAKTVLALGHEVLPRSLNFDVPSPHLELERTPFFVADRARPWPRGERPRLAGVSSFGVGGTNAHVVLEEAPPQPRAAQPHERPAHLFVLSADRPEALWRSAQAHAELLARQDLDLGDVCYTLSHGRPRLAHRLAIVARDRHHLVDLLSVAELVEGRAVGSARILRGQADPEAAIPEATEARARELYRGLPEAAQRATRSFIEDAALRARLGADHDADACAPSSLDAAQWFDLLELLGSLWVHGADVRFDRLERGLTRRRVPLPGLMLTRERCWWPALTSATTVLRPLTAEATPRPSVSDRPTAPLSPAAPAPAHADAAEISAYLRARISEALRIPLTDVGLKRPLVELGMDSVAAVELLENLSAATGQALAPSLFFEHPTIAQLAAALEARGVRLGSTDPEIAHPVAPTPRAAPTSHATPASEAGEPSGAIAIVGLAGRFPGAPDVESFWALLREGRHAITRVPAQRWPGGDLQGGFLHDIDSFDPRFFRVSDREARWMDPQQRLLLMTAWEAVEDAGYAGSIAGTRTGVYVGASYTHRRDRLAQDGHTVDEAHAALGNHNAILANRLSYFLDVRGPCLTVDTLCSSSLVALSTAVRSLREGECTQALVAGVHADLSAPYYQAVSRLGALSADGRCRAFGAGASGYVPGEGVGVVVLKPLTRALADGDHVYGVIRGVAVNHGGQSAGLTVPNPAAQADVIAAALRDAGVDGASISYVEAHGTGTALGDPIELVGLERALGGGAVGRCAVGSVKSNIGHLEPAAGLASLIKVTLMLRERTIVPTLFVDQLNPGIDLTRSALRVASAVAPWTSPSGPRRAGISSFGLGGVNAHVIAEEAPPLSRGPRRGVELVPLSAPSRGQLGRLVERWVEHLAGRGRDHSLLDLAFTACVGRAPMRHRAVLVADGVGPLSARLVELARHLDAPASDQPAADLVLGASATSCSADQRVLAERFAAGEDVDFAPLFAGSGARRVPLPPTPLELRPFTCPALERPSRERATPMIADLAGTLHPLLGPATRTNGRVTFEVLLPTESIL